MAIRSRNLMEPVAKPSYIELVPLHDKLHKMEEEIVKGEETGQETILFQNSFAGRVLASVDKIPENAVRYRIKCHPPEGEFDCSKLIATANDNCKILSKDVPRERIFLVKKIETTDSFYLRYSHIISITIVCLVCEEQKAKIKELLRKLNLIPAVCDQLALSYL